MSPRGRVRDAIARPVIGQDQPFAAPKLQLVRKRVSALTCAGMVRECHRPRDAKGRRILARRPSVETLSWLGEADAKDPYP